MLYLFQEVRIMKMIFALIMCVWAFCGVMVASLHNYDYKIGTWMFVISMLTVPFIPLIAKACGLI